MSSRRIAAVAVVVPVHDEEELLAGCLESLQAARVHLRRAHPAIDARIWAVLDACTDASAPIAEGSDVEAVQVAHRRVGAARASGVGLALDRFRALPLAQVWTAHTDADSAVPPHWLTHQVEQADAGADVVVGTVHPDFRDLSEQQVAAWLRRYTPGVANGHVHGANLGIRASTLVDAGGFSSAEEHEDVRLVSLARSRGARIVASDDAWVLTSGRQHGRTPGGYARYLREDLVAVPDAP
ncbi:glycosyltransferase family 2 protein [Microbacterium betulae]|uniref:4,4'-diaponeurosporenoate glycosyltransferase n=1 Tax=Microbacterium betulae TaxID=2981139 RepID=A0AA97FJK8_9MICO|nr:glycosyltransferase family 2 protein [Microbacterium sp. AB]WOF23943.1 glycosyltransferase family 2 protein [Microbacterium sp. AB]